MEIITIELYNSYKNGYNSTIGGEGKCGHAHSDETKRKLSIANKGINSSQYGKPRSKKIKKEISIASKKCWKENRDKMMSTRTRGENHSNSKLTLNKIKEIKSKYVPYKYSCHKLAKEYNVSATTICNIINNKIWKDEKTICIKLPVRQMKKLTKVDVKKIKFKYIPYKYSIHKLTKEYNTSTATIRKLLKI